MQVPALEPTVLLGSAQCALPSLRQRSSEPSRRDRPETLDRSDANERSRTAERRIPASR